MSIAADALKPPSMPRHSDDDAELYGVWLLGEDVAGSAHVAFMGTNCTLCGQSTASDRVAAVFSWRKMPEPPRNCHPCYRIANWLDELGARA